MTRKRKIAKRIWLALAAAPFISLIVFNIWWSCHMVIAHFEGACLGPICLFTSFGLILSASAAVLWAREEIGE